MTTTPTDTVPPTAATIIQSLSIVVHAESGTGKSWLADTSPAPRLILDAEHGSKFTPSQPKIYWDPARERPPGPETETCIVRVRDYSTVQLVFQWLNSGQHDFRSVWWDSLTEIQKRCLDAIAGQNLPRIQDWGNLLRQMEGMVRAFRDLTDHPIKPIEVVGFNALTMVDEGHRRPNVQGQLKITLPQFVDVVGYLYTQAGESGELTRALMTAPYPGYVAKDRTNKLGGVVAAPNIERMMEVIYDKQ